MTWLRAKIWEAAIGLTMQQERPTYSMLPHSASCSRWVKAELF